MIFKKNKKKIIFSILLLLPYFLFIFLYYEHKNELESIRGSTFILIDKSNYTLKLYKYSGELLNEYRIAIGKQPGDKTKIGDKKTPEGVFAISSIEESGSWEHDFNDDTLGTIKGAYGPYFIRLSVPGHKGIGIHGTHDNNSIGTRASEGCIRMNNNDLLKLVENIKTSLVVAIIPGATDQTFNEYIKIDK
jgi:lipoprotein-anchoring transpeptidase ErfK/SrfK